MADPDSSSQSVHPCLGRTYLTLSPSSLRVLVSTSLFAIAALGQTVAVAANPNHTLVGAIRWDGNIGDTPTFSDPPGSYIGQQTDRALGPTQYHFRLPFFGTEIDPNTVFASETTQAIMDQDIAYAKSAHIDYWAFVFYTDGSGMDLCRNLYDSSAHKSDVNYCYIASNQMPASYFPTLVSRFATSNYQKVLGNRPILYILDGGSFYSASDITNLRNQALAAGLGNPYIVVMRGSASLASSEAQAIGADAISNYVTGGYNGNPYSTVASADSSGWDSYRATGLSVVPWITGGWDPRPRIDNPVAGVIYPSNNWTQEGTPWEIAQHLQQGLNWVDSYPSVAAANAVIIYAWNELDEGFNGLCPSLYTGTDHLDALKLVTQPGVPGPNLLTNPGFESGLSPWVAQSASISQDSTMPNCGQYDCLISGRTAVYGAVSQNITSALLANGPGFYSASVSAAFASATDTIKIVIYTVDAAGSHWYTSKPMTLSTAYKQITGVINVTWTGTLSNATIYTQTTSSLDDLHEDDWTLNLTNRLVNPGFESGSGSWSAQASSITAETSYVHSGVNALLVANRTQVWGSATQDVTSTLLSYGPGNYTASAWLSFATATDDVQLVVSTVDDAGSHWFTTAPTSISSRFKNISDTIAISWTGTLHQATVYTQSASSLDDLYEDDLALIKQP